MNGCLYSPLKIVPSFLNLMELHIVRFWALKSVEVMRGQIYMGPQILVSCSHDLNCVVSLRQVVVNADDGQLRLCLGQL